MNNNLESRVAALEKDVAEIKAELKAVPRVRSVDALAEDLLYSAIEEEHKKSK